MKIEGSYRFHALDGLRGWASFAVLMSHFWQFVADLPLWSEQIRQVLRFLPLSPLGVLMTGRPAVLLFFMLSGFSLTCMLRNQRTGVKSYVIRRVVRIWLPYVVALVLCLSFIAWVGWPPADLLGHWSRSVTREVIDGWSVFWCLTLIGNITNHYNFVAWSLVQEMRLSLVFPLIYAAFQRYTHKTVLLFSFVAAGISVVLFYAAKIAGFVAWQQLLVTGHYAIFFVLGAAMALNVNTIQAWYHSKTRSTRAIFMVLALLLYILPIKIDTFTSSFNFPIILTDWISLPGIFLIMMVAISEPKVKVFLEQPVSRWLGEMSYSLYLFHPLVLFACMHFYVKTQMLWPAVCAGIVFSLVLARFAYIYIEQPSNKLGKRLA